MTICAAAICNRDGKDVVLGICDLMLTSGDIQSDSSQTKFYSFGRLKAVCMGAGDTEVHFAIAQEAHRLIEESKISDVRGRRVATRKRSPL